MLTRRDLLKSAGAASLTTLGGFSGRSFAGEPIEEQEVPWLKEIQTPPAKLPADAPKLPSLLKSEPGVVITNKKEWLWRAMELQAWWSKFVGVNPKERRKLPKLEILEEDRMVEGVLRQRVRYEVEPGIVTEAYICKPTKVTEKTPGVVAFHSTVDFSIRQPAGLEGDPEKAFGVKFAQPGRVVICPRNYLWTDNTTLSAQPAADRLLKRQTTMNGMGKMLYDGLVAVDILASLPEVDNTRLGAVGHSLGAKEVLYLAAFDERIKVSVSSEGGIGMKFSNWEADWYLGKSIRGRDFKVDHHELLALVAPRAFLLIGGESADGDRGWPFIAAAMSVHELFNKPCRIGQYNHRKGHTIPPETEKRIEEWFAAYL